MIVKRSKLGKRFKLDLCYFTNDSVHRRIQDFVRGGGQGPLGPRGGGGGQGPLGPPGSAPDYLGEQYFVGRGGGQGPLAPPPPGSAPGVTIQMYRPNSINLNILQIL